MLPRTRKRIRLPIHQFKTLSGLLKIQSAPALIQATFRKQKKQQIDLSVLDDVVDEVVVDYDSDSSECESSGSGGTIGIEDMSVVRSILSAMKHSDTLDAKELHERRKAILTREWSNMDVTKIDGLSQSEKLVFVAMCIFTSTPELKQFLPSLQNLASFLTHAANQYAALPYHNAEHAADVLYSCYCLLNPESIEPWEMYITLLGAIVHDIGHIGFSNRFLRQTNHPLCKQYGAEISIMESMHIDLGWKVLMKHDMLSQIHEPHDLNQMFRHIILGTDLARQKSTLQLHSDHDKLALLLHAADLGASTKSLALHQMWTARITTEFFRQGDLQRELNVSVCSVCDRKTSVPYTQSLFLTSCVIPVFEKVQQIAKGNMSEIMKNLDSNLDYWQSQL